LKLKEIVEKLDLEVKSASSKLKNDVKTGYASDIISDVMANTRAGDIWVTFQTHENMVAVANLNDLAAVIVVKGRVPDKDVIDKAEKEGVVILISRESAFEVAGRLHAFGISGKR
jgi:serine kinase of HPr protein (carbohydrate metabolism regulator)